MRQLRPKHLILKTREKRKEKKFKGVLRWFLHKSSFTVETVRKLKPKIRLMKSIVGMVKGSILATVSSETIGWECWDEAMKLGRFEVCTAGPVEGGPGGGRSGGGCPGEKKKEEVSKKNKEEE